jgi:hypothetical protein
MEYLTPAQMTETARKTMLQVATWDNLEGTWEVVLPIPAIVNQTIAAGDDITSVMMELDSAFEQNGLSYNLFEIDGITAVKVMGLQLA